MLGLETPEVMESEVEVVTKSVPSSHTLAVKLDD